MNASPENIMEPPTNQLAYALFSANMMSYVISAIIFAPGPPYRAHFFSNSKTLWVLPYRCPLTFRSFNPNRKIHFRGGAQLYAYRTCHLNRTLLPS